MRACLTSIVAVICWVGTVQAQYVESTGAFEEHGVNEYVNSYLGQIMAFATPEEQAMASAIRIVVFPSHPSQFVVTPRAFIGSTGDRAIVTDDAFLIFLDSYLEAFLMGNVLGDPYLPERWAYRYFAQVSLMNQGEMKQPGGFLKWSGERIDSFHNATAAAYTGLKFAVITDIMLHEIGHHVLDAFYDPRVDDPAAMKDAERAADRWAADLYSKFAAAKTKIGDKTNSAGRAFALLAMREVAAFISSSGIQSTPTHPTPSERIQAVLADGACIGTSEIYGMVELCVHLTEMAKALENDDGGLSTYSARADDGEAFASFRLGRFLFAHGKPVAACNRFQEAHDRGYRGRNLRFLAWCYEPESPTGRSDSSLAEDLYYQAASDGWAGARAWIRKFGTR